MHKRISFLIIAGTLLSAQMNAQIPEIKKVNSGLTVLKSNPKVQLAENPKVSVATKTVRPALSDNEIKSRALRALSEMDRFFNYKITYQNRPVFIQMYVNPTTPSNNGNALFTGPAYDVKSGLYSCGVIYAQKTSQKIRNEGSGQNAGPDYDGVLKIIGRVYFKDIKGKSTEVGIVPTFFEIGVEDNGREIIQSNNPKAFGAKDINTHPVLKADIPNADAVWSFFSTLSPTMGN